MNDWPKVVSDPLFRVPRDGAQGLQGVPGPAGAQGLPGAAGTDGVDGLRWAGVWSRRVRYRTGDVVGHSGGSFVSKTDNQGQTPRMQSNHWQLLATKGSPGERGATGDRGPRGRAGEGIEPTVIEVTFQDAVLDGTPCYLTSDGIAIAAKADDPATSNVVGLAKGDGLLSEGLINRPNWSGVAGTPTLTPGARYYLSPTTAGRITSVAPEGSGELVVPLAIAVGTITLDIEIGQSVVL